MYPVYGEFRNSIWNTWQGRFVLRLLFGEKIYYYIYLYFSSKYIADDEP